jgi:hypothetical protein
VSPIDTPTAEGQQKPKRARRACRVFDEEGQEVFVRKTCPHCGKVKPLAAFGLRRMGDGKIRCCPWCSACRAKPTAARSAP